MKKFMLFLQIMLLIALTLITTLVFAADPTVTMVPAPTFMAWFAANENAVLKFALAVSEFLGLFKVFQGNGIMDTIVKGLNALYTGRQTLIQGSAIVYPDTGMSTLNGKSST